MSNSGSGLANAVIACCDSWVAVVWTVRSDASMDGFLRPDAAWTQRPFPHLVNYYVAVLMGSCPTP